jgi:hypothetical protein
MCKATGYAEPIVGRAPPAAKEYPIEAVGYGPTRETAAAAAIRNLQGLTPLGYKGKHLQVKPNACSKR